MPNPDYEISPSWLRPASSRPLSYIGTPIPREIVRTFDESSWEIIFTADQLYTSNFVGPEDEALTVTGTVTFTGESTQAPGDLVFGNEALLPSIQPDVEQRFTCALEDNGFSLSSLNMDYDFDGDGTYEQAEIEARFVDFE